MAANAKTTGNLKRYTIATLASNGGNVRAWEGEFQAVMQIQNQNHFLLPEYSMSVPAHMTLALGIEVQVDRAIKAGRAADAAEARLTVDMTVSAEAKKKTGVVLRSGKKAGEEAGEELEEKAAKETKEKVEVHEGEARARAVKERKMRARAELMAARLATEQGVIAERRGGHLTVCYLDPLTALDLNDEEDKDVVCHVHTLHNETMRYAIEKPEQTEVRMQIDGMLARSLSAIPAHVTTGVSPGNIHERYKRVVLFFDDISRKGLIEKIDVDLNEVSKRERESFAAFTSRFQGIEFRMQEMQMVVDPARAHDEQAGEGAYQLQG
jgi:hypothetical protein